MQWDKLPPANWLTYGHVVGLPVRTWSTRCILHIYGGFLSAGGSPSHHGFSYSNGHPVIHDDWMIWGYPHGLGNFHIHMLVDWEIYLSLVFQMPQVFGPQVTIRNTGQSRCLELLHHETMKVSKHKWMDSIYRFLGKWNGFSTSGFYVIKKGMVVLLKPAFNPSYSSWLGFYSTKIPKNNIPLNPFPCRIHRYPITVHLTMMIYLLRMVVFHLAIGKIKGCWVGPSHVQFLQQRDDLGLFRCGVPHIHPGNTGGWA